jgi:hypothetical protein
MNSNGVGRLLSVVRCINIFKLLAQTHIESAMPPVMLDRSGFYVLCNGQMTTINGHYLNS